MTLYSLNGAYPRDLPHRIVLSDGRTRTDNTTFTAEELADAGWVEVADRPSVADYQTLTWENGAWVVTDYTADQMRIEAQKRRENIPAERWKYENKNILWTDAALNEYELDSSVESQRKIASVQTGITAGIRPDNQAWKIYSTTEGIVYRTTSNAEITEWSNLLLQKIQICFNTEKEVIEQINTLIEAGSYLEAINVSFKDALVTNLTQANIALA